MSDTQKIIAKDSKELSMSIPKSLKDLKISKVPRDPKDLKTSAKDAKTPTKKKVPRTQKVAEAQESPLYHFFYTTKSEFSHFHPSVFTINGVKFSCGEQALMYAKAELFGDHEIKERIMATQIPSQIKALGRKVKNFDDKIWGENREEIAYKLNYAKFSQDPNMRKAMFDTGDKKFVEAASRDRIWGVGLSETDPLILDPANWRGTNILGLALDRVKSELKQK